ncbi:MAG: hypothetical protein US46_C0017G0008 [Candidatus Shapirobacteria bacterium GW2011_GWF2_37_20]|nr:MAG: hypothetical protein US46_C0017G0008 [Candidatus Shapirobacteria bacterium GW2011_GWF2_37_20]
MIKRKPKLGNPKSKIKLPKSKSLKKACDDLWADIIKAKAGYKSELSGKEGKQIGLKRSSYCRKTKLPIKV